MKPSSSADPVAHKFAAALEGLVEQVKGDRSILGALVCGSLSHDTVWAKSDIDLVLVTIDDRKVEVGDICLNADGVNVHTMLIPRTEFRKMVEGSVRNSFLHSFLTKGRLLYTHDPTIETLCASLSGLGSRDQQVQLLRAATGILPPLYKAHKWFLTRGDLDYTALWLLYAATPLAQVEVISAGMLVDREVIPQAMRLNPALFKTLYADLLNGRKTRGNVQAALDAADTYLADRAAAVFRLVLEYLRQIGEARACREIEHHFSRSFDISGVTTACEYLADQGLIGKASTATRLTKKSNVDVQELAFFSLEP
ncbi:MAG: hypothetical protein ABIS06_15065 [Vicinamibacterales bacterium]